MPRSSTRIPTDLAAPATATESTNLGIEATVTGVSVVTFGLILIALFSYYTYQRTFANSTRRLEAVAIMLREAAEGHLAFEEVLSGDTQADYSTFTPHWDTAENAALAFLNGGETACGRIPALTDSSASAVTAKTLNQLRDFRALVPQRYALFIAHAASDTVDRQMDSLYTEFVNNTLTLDHHLRRESHHNMVLAKNMHLVLVLLYLVLAAILMIIFRRHEKNRTLAAQLLLKRNSQLRQAQKMETVGNLAGGIAHDFNNLLQTILGYGELLAADLAEAQHSTEEIDHILNAGRRAADLTRQLLAYSRRQMIVPTDIELNELIISLVKMLQRLIGENINLTTALSPNPLTVQADRTQMEQIFMNLCLNARDAIAGPGNVTIGVESIDIDDHYRLDHAWAKPGPYALLSVSDDGQGMTQAVIDQVFEPFFTTKEVGKGTGLGLSTVYGIVKQNEGMISIYSEPDQGTTIKIYWPLGTGAGVPEALEDTSQAPRGHETILVAEDEIDVRDFVVRVLTNAGYTVLEASDGLEAIDIFDTKIQAIDLALIDVVMPGAGGRAVVEHIRQSNSQIPVIFCSGYSTNSVHTDFVLHDGVTLLEKPYQQHELLIRLHQTLHPDQQD